MIYINYSLTFIQVSSSPTQDNPSELQGESRKVFPKTKILESRSLLQQNPIFYYE